MPALSTPVLVYDTMKHDSVPDDLPDSLDRRRFIGGLGAGVALVTAGCSGSGDGRDGAGEADGTETTPGVDEIHVLMDYASDAWQTRWKEEIIPGFEDEYGVSVNMEFVGFQGTSEQRLQTLIQSGDFPNSYQGSTSETADIIASGNAVPATDVNEDTQETNGEFGFDPSLITYQGEQWYVPHLIYATGTISYRTDIFDDLGLDPAETWSDLLSNAEAIDNDGNTEARGYNVGGTKTGQSGVELETLLRCAGGGVFRWKTDAREEAEVWFDEDRVVETLEFMQQLTQYSPNPTQTTWTQSLKYWAAGRIGQCFFLSAWPAGVAESADVSSVAQNTDITPLPVKEGADPLDRGYISPDSATLFDTDGSEAAKDFFRYLYGSEQRTIENLLMQPMRSFPAHQGILEKDAYRNADVFQQYDGHLYELNRKVRDDVLPKLSSPERPTTLATEYAGRFPILAETVNNVLAVGESPESAHEEARSRLERRLQEGKEMAANL